ncbi:hypothetical protein DL96DRAFT_1717464 [Flagelloscypha sp. PMI_526]|nr:hypothetical protein DL96DRAFT_1717464 [Flagelloscypha sp. PMI_526]
MRRLTPFLLSSRLSVFPPVDMGKDKSYRTRRQALIAAGSVPGSCYEMARSQDLDELGMCINQRLDVSVLDLFLSPPESIELSHIYRVISKSKNPELALAGLDVIAISRRHQNQLNLAVKNHAVELKMIKFILDEDLQHYTSLRRDVAVQASETRAMYDKWRQSLIAKYDVDILHLISELVKQGHNARVVFPQVQEAVTYLQKSRPHVLHSLDETLLVITTQFVSRVRKSKIQFGKGGENDVVQPTQNAC